MGDALNTAPNVTVLDVNWGSSYLLWSQLAGRLPLHFLRTTTIQQARAAGLNRWECRRLTEHLPGVTLRQTLFPPGWFSYFSFACLPWLARSIRRDLASRGLRPDTLVISYPQYLPVARKLHARRLVYYCVDDYRQYRPTRAQAVEEMENKAVAAADVVLCASIYMQQVLKRRMPSAEWKIAHVPNGTREEFLVSEPLAHPDELPTDLGHLTRPILGYLGGIAGRIDWDLIDEVLLSFPDATLLMIGPEPATTSTDAARLQNCRRRANFHFAGPRPQERIMEYIRAFDICLIPEPYTKFGLATCQQKVWNFLASSRPIVSTRILEQAMLQPEISIGDSPSDFCGHIQRLLECQGDDGLATRRLDIARAHTWPRIATRLWDELEKRGCLLSCNA